MPEPAADRLPPQITFIAWNEAAERFSYYGMSSILTLHMVNRLGLGAAAAERNFHLFGFAAYLTPLLGAWIADRHWGRYRTILWLSFGYVAGHATIALWESAAGLYTGMMLIALGAGGIKPCASAFAGDQIPQGNDRLVSRVYGVYYWMINLGSLASTFAIPLLNQYAGPRIAFGVPGAAMAFALAVFWAGRRGYVRLAPTGPSRTGFFRVVGSALAALPRRRSGTHWLDGALGDQPAEAVAGVKAVFRIAGVFAAVAVFWALFFQYASSWTVQAEQMRRDLLGWTMPPEWPQNLDAGLVLALIPLFALGVYPAVERAGLRVTPLRKMAAGMFVMTLSFVAAAAVEAALQAGLRPHVGWQVPQYLFLAVGEVLVSVTALEFAYGQAPRRMKSVVMALWYLTISLGQLLTAVVAGVNRFHGVAYFAFFAALMLGAAVAFALVAWRYRPVELPESAAAAPAS
jgi:proton-dependent oligopeptide transporter, POT family